MDSERPIRVLQIVNSLRPSGLEVMLQHCLPHWQRDGVSVDVCCQELGDDEMEQQFRRAGCRLMSIAKRRLPFRAGRDLVALLQGGRYDVVHCHLGYTSGPIVQAARRSAVPIIVSFHSAEPTSLWTWKKKPVLASFRRCWLSAHRRVIRRYASLLLGHSEVNAAAWGPRCRVMHNGIAIPETLPSRGAARKALQLRDDQLVLLHVANFRPVKNYDCLLDVCVAVEKAKPEMLLLLVGGGDYRERVARMVEQRGLGDRVRFAGTTRDPWLYYRAADLLLFPSWSEGCGNVVLEAQAAQLPVVASDIPAHRESVAPCYWHALFSPDRPEEGARAVASILQQGVDESAEIYVRDKYDINRVARECATLYRRLAVPSPEGWASA